MASPEIKIWLNEQLQCHAKKLQKQAEKKPSQAYLLLKEKLHLKIMLKTGANVYSQYWNIVNQAVEAGWPLPGLLKDKGFHLIADEFLVNTALNWMGEKEVELKPVPPVPHNADWLDKSQTYKNLQKLKGGERQ